MSTELIIALLFFIFLSGLLIKIRKGIQLQRLGDLKSLAIYLILIIGLIKFGRGGFVSFDPYQVFSLDFWFMTAILLFLTSIVVEKIWKVSLPGAYFALYRTKAGLKQMDNIARKYPRIVTIFGSTGVVVGIIGMIFIAFELIRSLVISFITPQASGVALVLPFKVQGGFYVPFMYWIISIFIIAVIHEFSHGVVARVHKTPVKSSGFAFLGLIAPIVPAAFVEPDDKVLLKKSLKEKLAVFAAGPFSNIVSGFIFLAIAALLNVFILAHVISFNGMTVLAYTENSSIQQAGIPINATVTEINGIAITDPSNISQALVSHYPNDVIQLKTANRTYDVVLGKNPRNESLPYLGVIPASYQVKESFEQSYGSFTALVFLFLSELFGWLFALSIGIGLFNLVPLGPIDGGQMLREILKKYIKNEQTALKVWGYVSLFFFAIIMISLFAGFV
ncbi:MAG TPA: site-2 protease family protein [Candidatus Nanoarchaeia archaeon]|nr:site-2 protease family protein [Candidatus Nanoarchaeia archaeon]